MLVKQAFDILGNPIARKHYEETGLTVMLPPIEDRVDESLAGLLSQKLMAILQQAGQMGEIVTFDKDIVVMCTKHVELDNESLARDDSGLESAIEGLKELVERITTTTEKNVFEMVCLEQIRRMEHQLNINKDTHLLFDAILLRLEKYTDELTVH